MSTSGAQATEGMPDFVSFGPGEKAAAIAQFLVALLSTLVLSLVLLCVAWVVLFSFLKRTSYQNLSREAFFFRSQLGQYATCLLLSNWIRAVSGLIDINWIMGGGVKAGPSCIAQGSLRQIGEYASFFFIVTMGIHTFNTLVLHNRPPQWLGTVVAATGWATAVIIGVAPVSVTSDVNGPFYGLDGLTCDISKSYEVAHMFLYFLPLFLAWFFSAIVYSLIFLMIRGTIVVNPGMKIHIDPERRLRPRSESFEEYQDFVSSVARTMIWFPISFILVFFPSSIVQLMEISGITASNAAMALACILERLDGMINVIILFNVLRTLGPAMKSNYSMDSEKTHSEQDTISYLSKDTKTLPTFSSEIQGPVTKTATPTRSPGTMFQGGTSYISSLFQSHKKTGGTDPPTHMQTAAPTSSSQRSESSSLTLPVERPIAPAPLSDVGLNMNPEANQKSTQPVPHLKIDLPTQHVINSTGLSPPPRGKRSRVSHDLSPISGSPTPPIMPSFEVTLCSPTTSPTVGGIGSLINMYISRDPTMSTELPPFPDTAGQRDSSASLPMSTSSPFGSPATRLLAPSAADLSLAAPRVGVGSPLKAAVSVGAVGGKPTQAHLLAPPLEPPSTHATSPAHSTSASRYPDSKGDAPPLSEESAVRDTKALQSGASREGQSSVQDHPAIRVPPVPQSRPLLSLTQSIQLHKSPSSSSRYGYL